MNTNNVNSFSENMRQTIASSVNQLAMLQALQKSLTSNETFVQYEYEDVSGEKNIFKLPSYTTLTNRLMAVEESIKSLTSGKGLINLNDGTTRKLTLQNIPHTPETITELDDPKTFNLDSNWFFEEFMFPGATVKIDLTGKIDDSSDRVKVSRIILDSRNNEAETLWTNDLQSNKRDYVSLKSYLAYNNVQYYEDIETIELPLISNTAIGEFRIIADPQIINNNTWYTLDTITYQTIDVNGTVLGNNNILSVGDTLCYQSTIYQITEINQVKNQIRLTTVNGVDKLGVNSVLKYYQNPFREKSIEVRFGAHEYNFIYVKGVDEDYNLLSNEWSVPVVFSSDALVLSSDENVSFLSYYNNYIVDWGQQLIADAREGKIKAYHGTQPNAPTLSANDLRVVQINTQINASMDKTEIKKTAAEIESTKSQINSLKNTITTQKMQLTKTINQSEYNQLQSQISNNTTDLQNLQASYTTLVNSLKTIARNNEAVTEKPKYHIRGFFPIPALQYRDAEQTLPEEIIGFDIAYRYICLDNTGTKLNTFTYTDRDGLTKVTGTFTDWIIEQGSLKHKVFNTALGRYKWSAENVADGSEININQIDIPITKGEKVEIKVRSISEAGYPENPLKSEWSNTIVIPFPSNLQTTNSIADLITEINDDALEITINNTLNALGVGTHLEDTIQNSKNKQFKHVADNIGYEQKVSGDSIQTISIQDKIDNMSADYLSKGAFYEYANLIGQFNREIKTLQQYINSIGAFIGENTFMFNPNTGSTIIAQLQYLQEQISQQKTVLNNATAVSESTREYVNNKIEYFNREIGTFAVQEANKILLTELGNRVTYYK